jgi:aminoglycoside phosphotransferase (APT) family kinase protein
MHADEVDIDADLVRRLVDTQFPQWARLPLTAFASSGTVNAIYRLGADMYVRLPLLEQWARELKVEAKWLPRMRPHIPLEIPEPLGWGVPAEGYPFAWAIYRWIEGEPWDLDRVRDERESAADLARFVRALHGVDTTGVEPVDTQFDIPLLTALDDWIRQSIELSRDMIDADALSAAWDAALELPAFDGPYVWVHGDLGADNVLVRNGRLNAVIDWGAVHVGDAARDLAGLWGMFSREGRSAFREAAAVDDATWARAWAWAIKPVGGIHYYRDTNPSHVQDCLTTVDAVLEDFRRDG